MRQPARTLLLFSALLGAGVLLLVFGTRARTRPSTTLIPTAALAHALASETAQHLAATRLRGPLRPAARPQASPFDFRSSNLLGALLVPMLSATKDAVLANDVNGNTLVNPGDTLRYTVTITNAMGAMTATGVNFADTIDANTSFVMGTLIASPIAVNDAAYQTIGNVPFAVNAAGGILANDFNPNAGGPCGACVITQINGGAFVNGSSVATANGTVTVNSDGSFTYAPNAGFRGPTDSFTYTLGNGTGLTDMATVTRSPSAG